MTTATTAVTAAPTRTPRRNAPRSALSSARFAAGSATPRPGSVGTLAFGAGIVGMVGAADDDDDDDDDDGGGGDGDGSGCAGAAGPPGDVVPRARGMRMVSSSRWFLRNEPDGRAASGSGNEPD